MINRTKFLQNIQRFRLVTFDITDTLIRFSLPPAIQYAKTAAGLGITDIDQSALEQCFKKEFKSMQQIHPNWGYHTPNYSWQQWWGQLVNNIFQCVKPGIEAEKLKDLTDTLLRIYRTGECYNHIDGGQELVKKFRAAVKTVGVISNSDPSLAKVLKAMSLADNFDFILTSYDVGFQKPHREIYESCLKRCAIPPSEALHIGNMYELDYVGARNAGWSSLLITSNETDLRKAQPTNGYRNIRELLYALDNEDIKW